MILDILASNNTKLGITINSQQAIDHFFSPASHINVILNEQINRDRIYNFFFDWKKDLTVLDVGANVGISSVFCSPSSKIVYAVEPTPSHFYIMNEVIAPFNNIKPINCAVWNKDEEIKFYVVNFNTTSNNAIVPTNDYVTVKGKKIQTIIEENNIEHLDLIKMDIEGSEFAVINDELLEYLYPIVDHWFLEVHTFTKHCSSFDEGRNIMNTIFRRHGYKTDNKGNDGLFIYK